MGIGKIAASGEAGRTASKVLSVTATLSPANKTLVLIEYLQRAGQLAVVRIGDAGETRVVNEVVSRPFQLLLGSFDEKHVNDDRAVLRSERRSGAGGPMVEVPLLCQNEISDDFWVDEGEYIAMGYSPSSLSGRGSSSPALQLSGTDRKVLTSPVPLQNSR